MMKKRRLLLIVLPLVAGGFYLCSLVWWGSNTIFQGTGSISHLMFSGDGKTLLVAQNFKRNDPQLIALDARHDFATTWMHRENEYLGMPQFVVSDTHILVVKHHVQILDSHKGETQSDYGRLKKAAISPDGTWLAYNGEYPPNLIYDPPPILSQKDVCLKWIAKIPPPKKAGVTRKIIGDSDSVADTFAFSPDGRTFVIGVKNPEGLGSGTHLDFYDVKTWKRIRVCQDLTFSLKQWAGSGHLQWSRDGRHLLVSWYIYGRQPYSVQTMVGLWRVSDGTKLASAIWQDHRVGGGCLQSNISPTFDLQNDGSVLTVDGRVFLSEPYHLEMSSKPLLSLPNEADREAITAATLTPDGSYLVAGTLSGRVFWKRLK